MSTNTDLIIAPVGITHLAGETTDLLRPAAAGTNQLRITTAAQLNGQPHLGTVTSVLTAFAVAAHASERLNLPAHLVFDALENCPGETVQLGGDTYTRTVGDLITDGRLDGTARESGFRQLLDWGSAASGIPHEIRPYADYQALPDVRAALHTIADRQDEFRSIVAPADGRIRIRPRCPEPQCRLMDKTARHLRVSVNSTSVLLDSSCPRHGTYRETIPVDEPTGWYDANTPIRSIQKSALLAAERGQYQACSVSVDGADWGGAWYAHVIAPGLATLGVPVQQWPISVFAPLITDATGGKLSKSLYVRHGAYAELPPLFLDLDVLLAEHGEPVLRALWDEVRRWAGDPRRLHRSYTVEYLQSLIAQGIPTPRQGEHA